MYINKGTKNNPDLNPRVTQQVIRETGEEKKLITEVWNHAVKFISESIREGELRPIQLPHLGKFEPNMRCIDAVTMANMLKTPTDESL